MISVKHLDSSALSRNPYLVAIILGPKGSKKFTSAGSLGLHRMIGLPRSNPQTRIFSMAAVESLLLPKSPSSMIKVPFHESIILKIGASDMAPVVEMDL